MPQDSLKESAAAAVKTATLAVTTRSRGDGHEVATNAMATRIAVPPATTEVTWIRLTSVVGASSACLGANPATTALAPYTAIADDRRRARGAHARNGPAPTSTRAP